MADTATLSSQPGTPVIPPHTGNDTAIGSLPSSPRSTGTPSSGAAAPQRSSFLIVRMHEDIQNPEIRDIGRKVGLVVALFFFVALILIRDGLVAFVNSFIADTVSNQETQARISEMANRTVLGLLNSEVVMNTLQAKLMEIVNDDGTRNALQGVITSQQIMNSVHELIAEQLRRPELTDILKDKVTEFAQDGLFQHDVGITIMALARKVLSGFAASLVVSKPEAPQPGLVPQLFQRVMENIIAQFELFEQMQEIQREDIGDPQPPPIVNYRHVIDTLSTGPVHKQIKRLLGNHSIKNFDTALMKALLPMPDCPDKTHLLHDIHTIVIQSVRLNVGPWITKISPPKAPATFEAVIHARVAAQKLMERRGIERALADDGSGSDEVDDTEEKKRDE